MAFGDVWSHVFSTFGRPSLPQIWREEAGKKMSTVRLFQIAQVTDDARL